MHFLLVTVLLLKIIVGFNSQISDDFVCEAGEEYSTCRSPCEDTCANIRRGIQPNCQRPCIPGCFCRRGLVRADDRTCVPPSECIRPVCQENEEYLDCGSPCESNCTNFRSSVFCTKPCYSGCFCKPDFVRDSRGKCIDSRKCGLAGNVQCQANEEYVSCVNFCNTCFTSEYCQTPYCTPGCDCKPGYFKNSYRQCISSEQCYAEEYDLQRQCGLNEVYSSCVNPCNDCYSRGICDDLLYCSAGCDCKPGFFRNENGICVPEWNCLRQRQPVCSPGEEYFDCIPTCRSTCDTYYNPDLTCDTTCKRGCFCKTGFIRRGDGLCVSPSECPARFLPCPSGEIFYECMPTCSTCRTLYSSREICSTNCTRGCFCQPGFVRNDDGFCVAPLQCPSVCRPNEEFRTCGSACPASCENFRERRICPQQSCLRGCFCKTGFVLGPKGNCIRPRDCPISRPTPTNGFQGRRLGNGNDDDDENTTPVMNITTTMNPETTMNESSTSSATKSPAISETVPIEITSKSQAATATLKPQAATTTLKSQAVTSTPQVVTDTTKKMPSTTPVERKTEPVSSETKAAETPAVNVTEEQTVITVVTASTELKNSTANAAETPATNEFQKQTGNTEATIPTDLTNSTSNMEITPATNVTNEQTNTTTESSISLDWP